MTSIASPTAVRPVMMPPDEGAPAPRSVDVSVVIPVYNEADNLHELVERVGAALLPTGRSFELLLIDDGSSDASREILRSLAEAHPWLRPLLLIRHYGQSTAL